MSDRSKLNQEELAASLTKAIEMAKTRIDNLSDTEADAVGGGIAEGGAGATMGMFPTQPTEPSHPIIKILQSLFN